MAKEKPTKKICRLNERHSMHFTVNSKNLKREQERKEGKHQAGTLKTLRQ